jgi:hypothetical protein
MHQLQRAATPQPLMRNFVDLCRGLRHANSTLDRRMVRCLVAYGIRTATATDDLD